MRYAVAAMLAICIVAVSAQDREGPQFEVASIKRNTSGDFPRYIPPAVRAGQFSAIAMSVRELITFGYPVRPAPAVIIGLPGWAESEQYDVMATLTTPQPGQDDLQRMWRALLADRMKLQAHYETRPRPAYDLVFARADKRPGPQLRPSTIDCTAPSAGPTGVTRNFDLRAMAMARCGIWVVPTAQGVGLYSGGVSMETLAMSLTSQVRRPVSDRTGLTGTYALGLQFANGPVSTADAATTDLPTLFTALQEQLGLKLQPSTIEGQVLVVDHVERPSEN